MPDFSCLYKLKAVRPLLHCVSNLVAANDCANVALAIGASPIMAQAPEEMEAITAVSQATVLNTGTPDEARFAACRICARAAGIRRQPLILDPVGVGASLWRLEQVQEVLRAVTPTILRANQGEVRALLRRDSREQGVDSPIFVAETERREDAEELARALHTVVLLSGPEDWITDGRQICAVDGGSHWMASVTGTGCMLSVLCGAFAAVESNAFDAAVLASAFWKTCASRAERQIAGRGPGSFHMGLLDVAGTLTPEEFEAEASSHCRSF